MESPGDQQSSGKRPASATVDNDDEACVLRVTADDIVETPEERDMLTTICERGRCSHLTLYSLLYHAYTQRFANRIAGTTLLLVETLLFLANSFTQGVADPTKALEQARHLLDNTSRMLCGKNVAVQESRADCGLIQRAAKRRKMQMLQVDDDGDIHPAHMFGSIVSDAHMRSLMNMGEHMYNVSFSDRVHVGRVTLVQPSPDSKTADKLSLRVNFTRPVVLRMGGFVVSSKSDEYTVYRVCAEDSDNLQRRVLAHDSVLSVARDCNLEVPTYDSVITVGSLRQFKTMYYVQNGDRNAVNTSPSTLHESNNIIVTDSILLPLGWSDRSPRMKVYPKELNDPLTGTMFHVMNCSAYNDQNQHRPLWSAA